MRLCDFVYSLISE